VYLVVDGFEGGGREMISRMAIHLKSKRKNKMLNHTFILILCDRKRMQVLPKNATNWRLFVLSPG